MLPSMRTRSQSRDDPLSSPLGLFASRRSEPSLPSRSAVPPSTPSATGSSAAPSVSSAAPIASTVPANPSSQASASALSRTSDVWIQTADGQRFALRSFVQSVVSEVVPDRAGRLSSIPFRVKALPIAGKGVPWRADFGVGVRPKAGIFGAQFLKRILAGGGA